MPIAAMMGAGGATSTVVDLVSGSWTAPGNMTVTLWGAEKGGLAGSNGSPPNGAGGGGGGGASVSGCQITVSTGEVISAVAIAQRGGSNALTEIRSSTRGVLVSIEAGRNPGLDGSSGSGGRGGNITWYLGGTTFVSGGAGGSGGTTPTAGGAGDIAYLANGQIASGGGGGGSTYGVAGGQAGGSGGGGTGGVTPSGVFGGGGGGVNAGSAFRGDTSTYTTVGRRYMELRY